MYSRKHGMNASSEKYNGKMAQGNPGRITTKT